jgi:hypothetical protein
VADPDAKGLSSVKRRGAPIAELAVIRPVAQYAYNYYLVIVNMTNAIWRKFKEKHLDDETVSAAILESGGFFPLF